MTPFDIAEAIALAAEATELAAEAICATADNATAVATEARISKLARRDVISALRYSAVYDVVCDATFGAIADAADTAQGLR